MQFATRRLLLALTILVSTAFGAFAVAAQPISGPELRTPAMIEWRRAVNLKIHRVARYLGTLSVRGQSVIAFRVERSGRIAESKVVRSSGNTELDGAFLAVVRTAGPFPPLPASYPRPILATAITMTSAERKGDFHNMRPLRPYPAEF